MQQTESVEIADCLKKGRSPTSSVQHFSSHSSLIAAESLPPEQAQVVAQLAQGRTITSAAGAAGVHRTTAHHWLRTSPEFKAAVDQAKRLYAASLADELLDLSAAALHTLRELLESKETQPAVRLKAALAVLERPRFPSPGWQLPAETGSARERQVMEELALIEADYKAVRMSDAIASARQREDPAAPEFARNAPCPCGSGLKYKRCCGVNAPPVIGSP